MAAFTIAAVEATDAEVEIEATEADDDADVLPPAPPIPKWGDTPTDMSEADVEVVDDGGDGDDDDDGEEEEVTAEESFLRVKTRPLFSGRTALGALRDCAKIDRYMDWRIPE